MESIASAFSDRSILQHYSTALNKVKAVLRGHQKESLEQLNKNIKLQIPSCYKNNFEYLSIIQNAISSRSTAELEYKTLGNTVSKRETEPIGLIFYAFNWHLIAWCRMRNEYRDFRVSRILAIYPTSEPFQKKDHQELTEYIKSLPVNY